MEKKFKPVCAKPASYVIAVEEGNIYHWCACGLSKKQPFCDGSHKGTNISSIKYEATESRNVAFCGCKQTAKSPLCDGAHRNITSQ